MSDWIPCEKELPKDEEVLAYATGSTKWNNAFMIANYSHLQNIWYWDDGPVTDSHYKVTHWQPLPTPPKRDIPLMSILRHSYSRTATVKTCFRKLYFAYEINGTGWEPDKPNVHFSAGRAYHSGQDALWLVRHSDDPDPERAGREAVEAMWKTWEKEGMPMGEDLLDADWLKAKRPEVMERVLLAYVRDCWDRIGEGKLIGVEVYFEIDLGLTPNGDKLVYRGVLDKLRDMGHHVKMDDHKTTAMGSKGGLYYNFTQSFFLNDQFIGIGWYLYETYDGEAEIGVDAALLHPTADYFLPIPVDPIPAELEVWLRCQRRWSLGIWEAQAMLDRGMHLDYAYPRNTESCVTKYGPCPFLDICKFNPDPTGLELPEGFRLRIEADPDEINKLEIDNSPESGGDVEDNPRSPNSSGESLGGGVGEGVVGCRREEEQKKEKTSD